ncbi:MAG: hypothetical protein CM15mV74_530 [uncultured marine virus]|nr:MAG: hypothetical protein CM15mV74_530 [uncultured marine virus]
MTFLNTEDRLRGGKTRGSPPKGSKPPTLIQCVRSSIASFDSIHTAYGAEKDFGFLEGWVSPCETGVFDAGGGAIRQGHPWYDQTGGESLSNKPLLGAPLVAKEGIVYGGRRVAILFDVHPK